jgi:hypothetical protein
MRRKFFRKKKEEDFLRKKEKGMGISRMADVKGPRPLRGARSAPLTSTIREEDFQLSAAASAAAAYKKGSLPRAAASAAAECGRRMRERCSSRASRSPRPYCLSKQNLLPSLFDSELK